MAEIKSTLDIIMEKTKGMAMSEEEKQAFKQKEVEAQVRGLIRKLMDGFLTLDRLKIEITAVDKGQQGMVRQAILDELLPRIGPGKDNRSLWDVLEMVCGINTAPLMERLADLEQELDRERSIREKDMIARLNTREISGSAIIPNIESDPDWELIRSGKESAFKENTLRGLV